ncbi:MAG: hypothetical protein U9R52_02480 [Candidatus Omnitrophota bacterium]|nr:hypothetical protein [Candidatus Omnitrophota bacterium]
MTKNDFSPEEKLLRLIKGTKKRSLPQEKIKYAGNMPGAGIVSSRPVFKLSEFDTRKVNSALIIFLLGLSAYFVFDLFHGRLYEKKKIDGISVYDEGIPEAPEAMEESDILSIQPYSYYSSSIAKRNIFMPQQVEVDEVITGPALEEVSAGLSLIGIITGNRPQAVIEEKKTKKSYFLFEGSSVGQAKLLEILEDSVVMEYQGQTFELVL